MSYQSRNDRSQAFQGKRKYLTIYGLEGFQSTKDRIHLSSNVVIKVAPAKYHANFWREAKLTGTRKNMVELHSNEFFLYHHYENSPTGNTQIDYEFAERFRQMFRCFQVGGIDIQFFEKHAYLYRKKPDSIVFSSNSSNYWLGNIRYQIDDSNVKFFKKFAKEFLAYDFNKAKAIDVALRRLDYSYDRRDVEDQIIDLIIGFEALFSDSSGEITYKLALRTATFLSLNYEADFVFDFMKKTYALRSSIVHGGKTKPMEWEGRKVDNAEVVELLQKFLRLALLKIILNKDKLNPQQLIAHIDSVILPRSN
jgi:hypothetical protein